MASTLFELKRQANEAVAIWTVHLSFPAFGLVSAANFYWTTARSTVLEDGIEYEEKLSDIPKGRHQRGRGNDYAEFSAVNADYELYQLIRPYEPAMEKCYVIIRKAYEIETGLFESEIMFKGYVKDFSLEDENRTLKFTVNSDMSRGNFLVGNRILTRERCGTEFNFNGANDPQFHKCGWQTAQGGNPLFCSKLLNGVDGCLAHNNTHRFYAVPALSTADVVVTGGPQSGWDYETDKCFSENMFVLCGKLSDKDRCLIPISEMEVGMDHIGFDPMHDDRLVDAKVLSTSTTEADEVWHSEFDKALIESHKAHLFYIGNATFAQVTRLGTRPAFGMNREGKSARSLLLNTERIVKACTLYSFHSSSDTYIITDEWGEFLYFVHNRKEDLPGGPYG